MGNKAFIRDVSRFCDFLDMFCLCGHDGDGNVVGIEILSASEKADTKQLIIQAFDKVMVEQPVTA